MGMRPFLLLLLALPLLSSSPTLTSSAATTTLRFNPETHALWIDHATLSGTATVIAASRSSPRPTPTSVPVPLRRQLGSSPPAQEKCGDWGMWQKVGLVVVVCLVIFPVVGLAIYTQQRKVADDRVLGEALRSLPGMPREFRFAELSRATGEFSESNVLGRGGFGVVYRGKLVNGSSSKAKDDEEEVTEVAVKTFSRDTSRGDFLAELTIINRLRHRNLVRLLGWCYKNKKLLLVYEYMPNGSLDKHLFCRPGERPLTWERRYNVLVGVASALHYLHNDYHQKVIHRDLKASNIMLDSFFNACLGDFGLARAVDAGGNTSYEELEGVPGTWGYIAPECFHTGKATGKSDVFAFGAVVLEVVCGRRPGAQLEGYRMLVDWVWAMYEEGALLEVVDLRLGRSSYPAAEAERLLLLGLACSHPIASERPKTQTILQVLSKSIPPPVVDKQRPAFVLPPLPRENGGPGWTSSSAIPSYGVVSGFTGCYCPPASPRMDTDLSSATNYFTCDMKTPRQSFEISDTNAMLRSHASSNRLRS